MKIKSTLLVWSSLLMLLTVAAAAEPLKVGEAAPDFTLNTLDGTAVKLSAENAKQPVVLVIDEIDTHDIASAHVE